MGSACAADAPVVMPRPWRNARVVTSAFSGLLLLLGFVGGYLYSISDAAEGYTAERARHAIRTLMDLAPKTALVRRDDQETRVPVEQIRVEHESETVERFAIRHCPTLSVDDKRAIPIFENNVTQLRQLLTAG